MFVKKNVISSRKCTWIIVQLEDFSCFFEKEAHNLADQPGQNQVSLLYP